MTKILSLCIIVLALCVAIYALNWSKLISTCFGVIADCRFPKIVQNFINRQYVAFFNINLNEFQPLESYKSLNELFTRGLRKMRDFDKSENIIISPCDSLVIESGRVESGRALQIKGYTYEVAPLLGVNARDLEPNLYYANLYLSPRDYHRYHAPTDMFVESVVHFKGALLPVHQKSLNKNQNLFIRNERVVLSARTKSGAKLYFVAVGALNVGNIVFYIEPKLQESFSGKKQEFFYKEPKFIRKGEELGMFKMGSTIVLFVESGNSSLELHSADFGIFGISQTPSLISAPKIPKNYESQIENLSVVDSVQGAESSEKIKSKKPIKDSDSAHNITIFKQGENIKFGEALFKLN